MLYSPHVSARCLQAHMAAVLKGRLSGAQYRLLAYHSPPSHSLKGSGEAEDSPVTLPKLNRHLTKVFQADRVAPLDKILN